jgi:tRNA(Arg) A34 adenosine deaminase TadA
MSTKMSRKTEKPEKISQLELAGVTRRLERLNFKHLAFVVLGRTVVFHGTAELVPWSTPAMEFLQIAFEEHQDLAFFMTRSKLWLNYNPTAGCYGMAKVLGKGVFKAPQIASHELLADVDLGAFNWLQLDTKYLENVKRRRDFDGHFVSNRSLKMDGDVLRRVFAEYSDSEVSGGVRLHDKNRKIIALLSNENGDVISAMVNTAQVNKSQHAEVNLLQSYFESLHGADLANKTLWVTHKPCKMCSGLIWNLAKRSQNFKVMFLHDEKGSFSSSTVLDLGSDDRKKFSDQELLNLKMQFQI